MFGWLLDFICSNYVGIWSHLILVVQLLGNNRSKQLTEEKKKIEKARKRSIDATWALSVQQKNEIDDLVFSIPFRSGKIKKPLEYPAFVKTTDWIKLQGELGIAAICPRFPITTAKVLHQLFHFTAIATKKSITPTDLAELDCIHEVLTQIEVMFPLYMNTINLHLCHHIPQWLADWGPVHGHHMCAIERHNRSLKRLVHVSMWLWLHL